MVCCRYPLITYPSSDEPTVAMTPSSRKSMVAQFFEKGDTEKIPETSKSQSLDIRSEDTEIEKEQQPETIQESEHVTKGQLISKCTSEKSVLSKIPKKIFFEESCIKM